MNKKALAVLEHLAHRWETRCDDSNENTGFLIRGAWLKKAMDALIELEKARATPVTPLIDELAQED